MRPQNRWPAGILILCALFSAASYPGTPVQLVATAIFVPGRFSVHKEGSLSGATIIPWSNLDGWGWRYRPSPTRLS